jgi:hypothetical protein
MIFNLIPTNPDYTVSKELLIEIEQYLNKNLPTRDYKVEQYDTIQFIDCGESFEKVTCNHCLQTINIELWQDWMTKSFETGFINRTIKMQCCAKISTLDKLLYEQPQGFAKFIIKIDNMPNDQISTDTFANIQDKIGVPIWIIRAKY